MDTSTTNTTQDTNQESVNPTPKASEEGVPRTTSKEDNFTVEKIVKKRVRAGKTQYLLKWAGFSDADNSWEDEDNLLGCQELLNEFNAKVKDEPVDGDTKSEEPEIPKDTKEKEPKEKDAKEEKKPRKRLASEMDGKKGSSSKKRKVPKEPVGFDHGDKVQDIIGARMINNVLHLYVQWKNKDICSFVPAEDCNRRIPQKVIEFYESRLKFVV